MITGIVSEGADSRGLLPLIPLIVRGFNGEEVRLEAMIDTGFSGSLALRADDVQALNLLVSGTALTELADGSEKEARTYFAVIEWDEGSQLVEVVGDNPVPLIGMQLLEGYNLSLYIQEGGVVTVTRLQP